MPLKTAYLSIGSNVGDRTKNIERSLELLEQNEVRVLRRSSLYETEPQDFADQPWFLNLIAEVQTPLFPIQLLGVIQRIETELGRQRTSLRGPRTIDIDVVLFARFVVKTPELEVPHPRMADRRFVLEPLSELIPEFRHPVTRLTVREMLAALRGQLVRKLTKL